jgi:hypothetical protein
VLRTGRREKVRRRMGWVGSMVGDGDGMLMMGKEWGGER